MHDEEIRARRMIAHYLSPSDAHPQPASLPDAAFHMMATQGQNYAGGLQGLALRTGVHELYTGTIQSHLDDCLKDYEVIRTWSQRGTLHFLHKDNAWIVAAIGKRGLGTIESSAQRFGITEQEYSEILERTIQLCATPHSRQQLRDCLGIDSALLSNVMRRLGRTGDLIQGAKTGNHDTFIRAEAVGCNVNQDASIGTLITNYFSTRGPAHITDCTWWSTLPKTVVRREAKKAVDAGSLLEVSPDVFMGSWQNDVSDSEMAAALQLRIQLPPFDEYLMSYTQRDVLFSPQCDPLSVLTKNGISWPFMVSGGVIIGRSS
ncbi:hypothetical protein AY498_00550 [Corynebacterium ulcerans]|uniref:DNA glycosylase AlkZ-like family protein n=1 Tax=Corynebacterium ulcerans TaxID=65058 RepID=UPI000C78A391|nr:crosslink repair DNA glycosylase YcaQ family protein [Corynebacterium ulcerans]PLW01779.1 hypothetical protein BRL54_09110 [Corynebacterium ulcerans]PME08381.1 hypothetical protein AY498_00550 [Corynebacterium ulcerans]